MRNLKAYGKPLHFLQEETIEVYVVLAALENQVWRPFFKGELRVNPQRDIAAGVEVVLVSPQNHVMAFTLTNPCCQVRFIANLHEGCTRTCYRESRSIWESSIHHLPKAEHMC